MAVKLSPGGVFAKWIVVPVVLALLGYYLIGPRLGKSSVLKSRIDAVSNAIQQGSPVQTEVKTSEKHVSAGPDMDVTVNADHSVQSVTQVADAPVKHVHKRRHKVVPKDPDSETLDSLSAKPAKKPDPDEGGSAGSTTAG